MDDLDKKWIIELNKLNNCERLRAVLDNKTGDFRSVILEYSDFNLFLELVYCLLTAQTKFVSASKVVSVLQRNQNFEMFLIKSLDTELFDYLMPIFRQNIIRFHNNKARNIVRARNLFIKDGRHLLREKLLSFEDNFERRNWLIDNVLGFSYKEASHFLRNIGFGKDLAILDRHVLRTLKEIGIIDELPKSLSKNSYLKTEEILRNFSSSFDISMERLDFFFFALSKKNIEGEKISVIELIKDLK